MTEFDLNNPFNDASKDGMLPDGCGIFERYYTSGQEVDLCGLSPNPDDYETPQTLYVKILDLVKKIIVAVDLNADGTYKPSDFDIYPLIANATSVKDAVERLSKYIEDLQQKKFDKLNLKLKYENGNVSLVFNDEAYTTINIPEEQFLDSEETKFISAATIDDYMNDSSVIVGKPYLKLSFKTIDASGKPSITYTYIPMTYLFNVYGVEDTNSIDMHMVASGDTNVFSGDLRVNDVSSNALKVDALGAYVEDLNPVIEAEQTRAEAAEKALDKKIEDETTRATNMEYKIISMVSNETDRANRAEKNLQDQITIEVNRASNTEQQLYNKIQAEETRAANIEGDLRNDLNFEIQRSTNKDILLENAIKAEETRATNVEEILDNKISDEVTRAETAEKTLTDSLTAEIERAKTAEKINTDAIVTESDRAKSEETRIEKELNDKISDEITRATSVENELNNEINNRVRTITGGDGVIVEAKEKSNKTIVSGGLDIDISIKVKENGGINLNDDGLYIKPFDTELDSESTNAVENKVLYEAIKNLQEQLNTLSKEYAAFGFARINGAVSPEKLEDYSFGDKAIYDKICSHLNMGLIQDGQLYKRCANGRIDLSVDNIELYIDGSDGDIMLYTDVDLYFLKGTFNIAGLELNMFVLSLLPYEYQGVKAKKIAPFAYTPHYAVFGKLTKDNNIKGVEDLRVCSHSVYNKNLIGTYSKANPIFTEVFKPNGGGYFSHNINYFDNVWMAQAKNQEQTQNRPYMAGYYEFYEIIAALIYMGQGSLYTSAHDSFGMGMCSLDNIKQEKFFDNMFGCTLLYGEKVDGERFLTKNTSNVYLPSIPSEADGDRYAYNGLAGVTLYGITEMLEPQRLFNDLTKYNLTNKVWDGITMDSENLNVIFEYNDNNELIISNMTMEDVKENRIKTNHKYYQVRNVPKFKGINDGVMTGVINVFIRMEASEGTVIDISYNAVDLNNEPIENRFRQPLKSLTYKLSHCLFKGYEMLGGAYYYVQGCYQQISNADEGDGQNHLHNKFMSVSSVDKIPAYQTNYSQYYGDINEPLPIDKWCDIIVQNDACYGGGSWKEKSNYNAGFFCFTEKYIPGQSNIESDGTYECGYSNNGNCLGNEDESSNSKGVPAIGRKVITCASFGGRGNSSSASLKAVDFSVVPTFKYYYFGSSFSVPYLKL